MANTYPAGTHIMHIENFDRSIKVEIECPNHPDVKYVSKDPYTSRWFTAPSNSDAFGNPLHDCHCPLGEYVTSTEYTA